jgi:secondary thiamine-phosphate synthase enzyme
VKQKFFNFNINTNGQKLYGFTDELIQWIKKNNFKDGIVNLSIHHTSASIIVQENADPDVQTDLVNYYNKLVPMNESLYTHTTEGLDDMPAHIKSMVTNTEISIPIKSTKLDLGTWQGIFLIEHRKAHGGAGFRRLITLSLIA